MGLERLSILIMDDVLDAQRRAEDEAWREMHRRPDALPMPSPAGAIPGEEGVVARLAHRVMSVTRRAGRPSPAAGEG